MTPDEAMQHPWILEHFQSLGSKAVHTVNSTSDAAPSTSGAPP